MLFYCFKRLLGMVPVFFGVTLLSFFIIQLAPGKPTDRLTDLNPRITPEARARLEQYYGLDKPIIIQYVAWLSRVVRFDFGTSFSSDARPVLEKIWDRSVPVLDRRLMVTFLINVISFVLIMIVAVPVGVLAAYRPHSWIDRITSVVVFVGFAAPKFWIALLLMMLFSVTLGWFPISGIKSLHYASLSETAQYLDRLRHLALPVFVSACGGIAGISRYLRASMLETLSSDFIVTARAKGLPESTVVFRHALRNALLPIITLLGLSVPGFVAGSVIFETIFGIPGMGQLSYQAIMMRDYPVIMGLLCITALLTMIGNLIADVCYAYSDPRIRMR